MGLSALGAWISESTKLTLGLIALVSVLVTGLLFMDGLYVHKTTFAAHEKAVLKRFNTMDLHAIESERTIVTGQVFSLERLPRLTSAEVTFLIQLKNRQAQIEGDITAARRRLFERGDDGP